MPTPASGVAIAAAQQGTRMFASHRGCWLALLIAALPLSANAQAAPRLFPANKAIDVNPDTQNSTRGTRMAIPSTRQNAIRRREP